MNDTQIDEFLSLVEVGDECWRWNGLLNKGTPIFQRNYTQHSARRVLLALLGYPIQSRTFVTCRHVDCVNPAHFSHERHQYKPQAAEGVRRRVEAERNDECWMWAGASSEGYGVMAVGKDRCLVHRYAYELRYGPIPSGLFGCHKCDNRGCYNPDHIFPGTPKENSEDMVRKDRQKGHWRKTVPDAVKAEIIKRVKSGESPRAVAKTFGISAHYIYRLALGNIEQPQCPKELRKYT